jgi:hypothetical protein
MKDNGAIFAGEHGGGGDAGLYSLGKMVNESSDRDAGLGWRGVVQVIELFVDSKGDNDMGTTGTTKGTAKAGTQTNIKRMSDGLLKASLLGGEYVYGTLSIQKTDLIDFDHYYKSTGERIELGDLCKCVVDNLIIKTETEPTDTPPDDEPPPVGTDTMTIAINGVDKYRITGTLEDLS